VTYDYILSDFSDICEMMFLVNFLLHRCILFDEPYFCICKADIIDDLYDIEKKKRRRED
jgi:hypothetical protein